MKERKEGRKELKKERRKETKKQKFKQNIQRKKERKKERQDKRAFILGHQKLYFIVLGRHHRRRCVVVAAQTQFQSLSLKSGLSSLYGFIYTGLLKKSFCI